MRIHLIAVGTRMPSWVEEGYGEYAKRMPRECCLALKEIPLAKRQRNSDVERLVADEGQRMLAAIPDGSHVIALDVTGKQRGTPELAAALEQWLGGGRDVCLLVGGPDGLAPACLRRARERWSLSPLTLPHPLVRILLAEQLYRAWSIVQNHPYHR